MAKSKEWYVKQVVKRGIKSEQSAKRMKLETLISLINKDDKNNESAVDNTNKGTVKKRPAPKITKAGSELVDAPTNKKPLTPKPIVTENEQPLQDLKYKPSEMVSDVVVDNVPLDKDNKDNKKSKSPLVKKLQDAMHYNTRFKMNTLALPSEWLNQIKENVTCEGESVLNVLLDEHEQLAVRFEKSKDYSFYKLVTCPIYKFTLTKL